MAAVASAAVVGLGEWECGGYAVGGELSAGCKAEGCEGGGEIGEADFGIDLALCILTCLYSSYMYLYHTNKIEDT